MSNYNIKKTINTNLLNISLGYTKKKSNNFLSYILLGVLHNNVIIDLNKTLKSFNIMLNFIEDLIQNKGIILFIGTDNVLLNKLIKNTSALKICLLIRTILKRIRKRCIPDNLRMLPLYSLAT